MNLCGLVAMVPVGIVVRPAGKGSRRARAWSWARLAVRTPMPAGDLRWIPGRLALQAERSIRLHESNTRR
jgi:hypothetical protein